MQQYNWAKHSFWATYTIALRLTHIKCHKCETRGLFQIVSFNYYLQFTILTFTKRAKQIYKILGQETELDAKYDNTLFLQFLQFIKY